MELQETKNTLNSFAKYVIQQSRSNLTKGKKNVSKKLYDSLGYNILSDNTGFILQFIMEEYGSYQDQGVSGTKKKYIAAQQGWKCKHCNSQLDAWYEVDHIIRLEHGGSNHVTNLVALCRNCHGKKQH